MMRYLCDDCYRNGEEVEAIVRILHSSLYLPGLTLCSNHIHTRMSDWMTNPPKDSQFWVELLHEGTGQ